MTRNILFAGVAAVVLSAAALPATAGSESISKGTWYSAQFNSTFPSFVFGGVAIGVGTSPTAVATTGGSTSWTITLTSPAALTVVDIENSGDQFAIFDNGAPLGDTSVPVIEGASVGQCISCALANPDFSRGVFFLGAGVNDITIEHLGFLTAGDVEFEVGSATGAPEPAEWALMLAGFAGLGAALRGRRKALASPA